MFKKVKVRVLQEINGYKIGDELYMLEGNLKYFIGKVEVIDKEEKKIKKTKNKAILKNSEIKSLED
ncbi:hypothetical protein D8B46_00595 [Candidatus Gracilibacteria bacterium]|nr:MAG: hypothetical protein D8B46_00595 [Candidatus Gracilibacteria bacterium]